MWTTSIWQYFDMYFSFRRSPYYNQDNLSPIMFYNLISGSW